MEKIVTKELSNGWSLNAIVEPTRPEARDHGHGELHFVLECTTAGVQIQPVRIDAAAAQLLLEMTRRRPRTTGWPQRSTEF